MKDILHTEGEVEVCGVIDRSLFFASPMSHILRNPDTVWVIGPIAHDRCSDHGGLRIVSACQRRVRPSSCAAGAGGMSRGRFVCREVPWRVARSWCRNDEVGSRFGTTCVPLARPIIHGLCACRLFVGDHVLPRGRPQLWRGVIYACIRRTPLERRSYLAPRSLRPASTLTSAAYLCQTRICLTMFLC